MSAAVRCSTFSTRRTRARTSRRRPKRLAWRKLYAQYRVLAASNRLIEALGVTMPSEGWSNESDRFNVNQVPATDRQENSMPYPVMGPPALASDMAPAAAPEPVPEPAPEAAPTTGQ